MPESRPPVHTGGCQCGAVRYALFAEPVNPHVCHCRMCQKAFGGYFAPLAAVPLADFAWLKGTPGVFHSSQAAERGFCRDCGTPLYMKEDGDPRYEIATGTLDDPELAPPSHQVGIESELSWLGTLANLPRKRTKDDRTPEDLKRLKSLQHPDHDTKKWPA